MPLHVLSTVVLIIRSLKLHYTVSGITTMSPLPTCVPDGHLQSVMIPDAVKYTFDLLMMSTTVLETCRGI